MFTMGLHIVMVFKIIVEFHLDPRFDFLLKTMVAVESRWDAQTKKVGAIFGVFDIEQIVVLDLQILDERHVVQIIPERCTHCRRPGKLCILAPADSTDLLPIHCGPI